MRKSIQEEIQKAEWRVPAFWVTQQEIKEQLKKKQEEVETLAIGILASRDVKASLSCRIYLELGLSREGVKIILKSLEKNRHLQATMGNLLGATRFKTVENGLLVMTECPKCKKIDSWEHHKICYGIQTGPLLLNKQGLKGLHEYLELIKTERPAKHTATVEPFYT